MNEHQMQQEIAALKSRIERLESLLHFTIKKVGGSFEDLYVRSGFVNGEIPENQFYHNILSEFDKLRKG